MSVLNHTVFIFTGKSGTFVDSEYVNGLVEFLVLFEMRGWVLKDLIKPLRVFIQYSCLKTCPSSAFTKDLQVSLSTRVQAGFAQPYLQYFLSISIYSVV